MPKKLAEILNDNTSGSEELLDDILELLANCADLQNARENVIRLRDELGVFGIIESFLNSFLDKNFSSVSDLRDFITFFRKTRIGENKNFLERVSVALTPYKNIVTISNSKTVFDILVILSENRHKLNVTVSESRPENEGAIFASKLAKSGINVNLVTEAMLPEHIRNCDALLIGADKILANGDVINKTGSYLLAILADYFNKPFFVIARESKKSSNFYEDIPLEPASEIFETDNEQINIINRYFELVPNRLITRLLF